MDLTYFEFEMGFRQLIIDALSRKASSKSSLRDKKYLAHYINSKRFYRDCNKLYKIHLRKGWII